MTPRYLAIAWDHRDEDSWSIAAFIRRRLTDSKLRWDPAIDQPGLFVGIVGASPDPQQILTLSSRRGVIIGTIFERSKSGGSSPRVTDSTLDPARSDRIVQTRGRNLVEDFWGSYVLFQRQHAEAPLQILRGPMSRLSCFYTTYRGVHLFFSDVEIWIELRLCQSSINFRCIRAQASYQDYLTRETAIDGISEMLSGELLTVDHSVLAHELLWNPNSIALDPNEQPFDEAADELRSTTQLCVDSWASGHASVVHTLSGGIDSSIVLGCLQHSPARPRATCLNLYSRNADERRYARSMARHYSVELVERERNADIDLRKFLTCARTARPVLNFSAVESLGLIAELSQSIGARLAFDGELGDNVFGAASGCEVVAEVIARSGFGGPTLNAARDLAHLRRYSVWRVLKDTALLLQRSRSSKQWNVRMFSADPEDLSASRLLATDETIRECQRAPQALAHPWFSNAGTIPLGKFFLVYGIAVITSTAYHSPFPQSTDPTPISPLASQPVVEFALRTDSALNIRGGVDRALARHAFAPYLSNLVLNRRGKSEPTLWLESLVRRNRAFLREVLLDGVLAKEGIIDRGKLEGVLFSDVNKSTIPVTQIIVQLYIEAWLRRWMASETRAAA